MRISIPDELAGRMIRAAKYQGVTPAEALADAMRNWLEGEDGHEEPKPYVPPTAAEIEAMPPWQRAMHQDHLRICPMIAAHMSEPGAFSKLFAGEVRKNPDGTHEVMHPYPLKIAVGERVHNADGGGIY